MPISPFQRGELKESDIGYKIPAAITCSDAKGTTTYFKLFDTKAKYLEHRLDMLGVEGGFNVSNFTDNLKAGYNFLKDALQPNGFIVSLAKDFQTFEFELNERVPLTHDFEDTVKA